MANCYNQSKLIKIALGVPGKVKRTLFVHLILQTYHKRSSYTRARTIYAYFSLMNEWELRLIRAPCKRMKKAVSWFQANRLPDW